MGLDAEGPTGLNLLARAGIMRVCMGLDSDGAEARGQEEDKVRWGRVYQDGSTLLSSEFNILT